MMKEGGVNNKIKVFILRGGRADLDAFSKYLGIVLGEQ